MKQFISAMLLILLAGMPIQVAFAANESDTSQGQQQEMQLPDDEAADSADDNTGITDDQGGEADQPMDSESTDPQADSQEAE